MRQVRREEGGRRRESRRKAGCPCERALLQDVFAPAGGPVVRILGPRTQHVPIVLKTILEDSSSDTPVFQQ